MYKQQRLDEMRQEGECLEGKLRLEMRRRRKRNGLAGMGQRGGGGKVNVVYTVGGKMREEKMEEAQQGGIWKKKGHLWRGDLCFLGPQLPLCTSSEKPSPSLYFRQTGVQ